MKFEKMSSLGTFFGVVAAAAVALSCGGCDRVPEGVNIICPGVDFAAPKVTCAPSHLVAACFLDEKPPKTFQSCQEKIEYRNSNNGMPYELSCSRSIPESCAFTLPGNYPEQSLTFGVPPKTKAVSYEGGMKKVTVTF